MSLCKYFAEERHALDFMRLGAMRFGSLGYYRGIEDGGVRGDPKDGTLHYAPEGGFEVTRVRDGAKFTGTAFTTAAESMFVYCLSGDMAEERATGFGTFCVELLDPAAIMRRLRARAKPRSKLDYARVSMGATEYRPLDKIPAADWAIPERVVLIKPPEYAGQNEVRIVLPLKPGAVSTDEHLFAHVGNIEKIIRLHVLG